MTGARHLVVPEAVRARVAVRPPRGDPDQVVGLRHDPHDGDAGVLDLPPIKRVVPKDDRRAARRRAKEIASDEAIGAAVGSTLRDVQAATTAAIVAATAAGSAGSS